MTTGNAHREDRHRLIEQIVRASCGMWPCVSVVAPAICVKWKPRARHALMYSKTNFRQMVVGGAKAGNPVERGQIPKRGARP